MLLIQLSVSHSINMEEHTAWMAQQSVNPIHLHSLYCREESSLPGCVPPNDTINSKSLVGIKSGDSGMVIGCQFDEFTHTWSIEHFCLSHAFILVSQARYQH